MGIRLEVNHTRMKHLRQNIKTFFVDDFMIIGILFASVYSFFSRPWILWAIVFFAFVEKLQQFLIVFSKRAYIVFQKFFVLYCLQRNKSWIFIVFPIFLQARDSRIPQAWTPYDCTRINYWFSPTTSKQTNKLVRSFSFLTLRESLPSP